MAFSLNQIRKTRSDMPPRTLVYGAHKIGKTSFAAAAPACVFIQTEDGAEAIDGEAFPLCRTWQDVLDAVGSLYSEPHEYKTVALDSMDWAERLLHKHLCEQHGVKSIELVEKGYGKGYVLAAEVFGELLDGLNALRTQKGMHVVLLCHAEIRRFDDPTADSYDRYQLKLHKQVGKLAQEWADVIGFAALDTVTKVEKEQGFKPARNRALTTGRRVLHLQGSPAFEAGNRYGLPPSIPLDWQSYETALAQARAPITSEGAK
jgi:hypothetical protein